METRGLFALVVFDGIPAFAGMTEKMRYDGVKKKNCHCGPRPAIGKEKKDPMADQARHDKKECLLHPLLEKKGMASIVMHE